MEHHERLAASTLYLCTDARRDTNDLAEFADAVLAGGVDIIQLRDKGSYGERRFGPLEAAQALAALAVLYAACKRHGTLLAVNDRADLALAAGAHVLHLGQDDLPVEYARRILGPDMVIGWSTHNTAQTKAATEKSDPDYFSVGPCWSTPTKPGRVPAGLDLVRTAAAVAGDKPWFAIGGIDLHRLPAVLEAGASRVAVVRAINCAADPCRAAEEFKTALR